MTTCVGKTWGGRRSKSRTGKGTPREQDPEESLVVGYGFLLPATVEVANDGHEGWEIMTGGGNTADKGQGIGERPTAGKGSMPFNA